MSKTDSPESAASSAVEPQSSPVVRSDRLLATLIISSALIAGASIMYPLFRSGYLMNFDHPMQQGIIKCALDSAATLPTARWCSFMQAGLAPFQSYPSLFYELVLSFTTAASLEIAYKSALVLIWIALPTIVAASLFRRGQPIFAALAFALLLLDHGLPDAAGLEFFIFAGSGFNQILNYALLAAVYLYSITTFNNPTKWRIGFLSILTALYFLSHPPTSLLYMPIFLAMLILYRKNVIRRYRLFMMYLLITALLVCYFVFPVIANMSDNEPGAMASSIGSQWQEVINKIIFSINPAVLLLGIAGLILMTIQWRRGFWAVPALAVGILLAWTLHPLVSLIGIFDYSEFHRTIGIMHSLVLIGCAYSLDRGIDIAGRVSSKKGFALMCIAIALSGYVIGDDYSLTMDRVGQTPIITSSQPLFQPLFDVLGRVNASSGRVLLEETFGQTTYPVNQSTFWGVGPIATQSDLIHPTLRFFKYPYSGTKDYQIMNQRIEMMGRDSYLTLLEDWNIEYIVAGSGPYRSAFRFLPVEMTVGPMIVYKNTLTPVSYFRIGKGTVGQTEYKKTYAKVRVHANEFTNLIFKVRHWGNWVARVDGRRTDVQRSQQHLMLITVSEGDHVVEFEFIPRWWDYLGHSLTAIGLAWALWLAMPRRHPVDKTDPDETPPDPELSPLRNRNKYKQLGNPPS